MVKLLEFLDRHTARHLFRSSHLKCQKFNSAWDFLGVYFRSGIFLGFVGSPRDFFGVLIFALIPSSLSLEIPSTPLGLG